MLEGILQPMHLLVIFGIALLMSGPRRLPELGKGIGEGIRGLKSAMKEHEEPPQNHESASRFIESARRVVGAKASAGPMCSPDSAEPCGLA